MDFGPFDELIARHGSQHVVDVVAPYLTEARLARIEAVLRGRLDSLHVAAERPEDPHNVAAIVRTAEALGAMHVHGVEVPPRSLHGTNTTQGSYHWLHTYHHPERADFLACVRARGVRVAGAAMDGVLALSELPVDRPLCLLFGNEKVGLSAPMREACDLTFRIPMVGMSESLNLSVSAAIALHDVSSRRRALLGRPGDLEGEALVLTRARYYARSLEWRMLEALFP